MVCNSLDPEDIWNCASCSKDWYSYFGPYRFKSVSITHSNDRTSFYSNNSYHIRELKFTFMALRNFDVSHCTRLRKLELRLEQGDFEINDDVPEFETRTRAADLIQRNRYLTTIRIQRRYGYCSEPLFPQPILDAIKNHPFITTIAVKMGLACGLTSKFLAHLPPQLLELDMSLRSPERYCTTPEPDHPRGLHFPKLSLRRLMLTLPLSCFDSSMFLQLLSQCPDLEELEWPTLSSRGWFEYDPIELAQVLGTHCKRLHTLNVRHCNPMCNGGVDLYKFFQAFSNRIRHLDILLGICDYPEEHDLKFLRWCPRLQWLSMSRYPFEEYVWIYLSDVVEAMDEPWECWKHLEFLKMNVDVDRDTSMNVFNAYRLFLKLRSLPQLRTLELQWDDTYLLTLNNLNGIARIQDSILMTEEDYAWMGL
ncbi:hypothetical protein BGX31_009417 [Mortierella sp. GBA43]|nr:hypothetical protein BGX31_009417 [Mortierella sp. GBA43]